MASTLVPAIRRRWPGATIGWVVGQNVAPFVHLIDGVDEVIEVDERLTGSSRVAAIGSMVGTWLKVGRRWDRALVAHTDSRYALLSLLSGAASTSRFANDLAPRPAHWHGSEYLRLLAGEQFPLQQTPYASLKLDKLPPSPLSATGRLVVVAPGSARNTLRDDALRRWPLELWYETITRLRAEGLQVVAVGSAVDAVECARAEQAGAVNYCGRTTLPELMSIIQRADVVISHDAGPLHLAMILQRPLVALFGPTAPNERVPAGANVSVLTRADDLSCAPCYDGFTYAKCALNLCLTRVPALEVVNAALSMLAGNLYVRER